MELPCFFPCVITASLHHLITLVQQVSITVQDGIQVAALLQSPPRPVALFLFAHGAGAGMNHSFMSDVANELESLGIGTLRYQFPYMQRGSKRTDPPELCHATVRAAVAEASRLAPGVALFAGGKSFGGRMTSQAQALGDLQDVKGLVFFGFPLHPAGKPSDSRGKHLFDVKVPMLFLQGTRDELASLELFEPLMRELGSRASVHLIDDADHSFHVRARTGRKDPEVRSEMLQVVAGWMESVVGSSPSPHPPLR